MIAKRPRVVVVAGGAEDDPWALAASRVSDATWVHGGERTLYELAVAAAGLGYEVELRGEISETDFEEVCRWGGGTPVVGLGPRRPDEDDLVVLPEGSSSALAYLSAALSPARAVLYLLAAPSLFGPPVLPGFTDRPPLEVAPDSVSRPEHYRALRDLGFELWTNSPAIAEDAAAAGVGCAFTGTGQPIPYPAPGARPHDVAIVADNRWVSLSREVTGRLRCSVLEIPRTRRTELVEALASARILVHPPVVEGQGRIQLEARAVGTVPVSLRSNRYVAGQEEGGGVLVDSLDEMISVVERLLADPRELAERSALAVASAREQADWERYVRRVDELLSAPAPTHRLRSLRARTGDTIEGVMQELRDRRRQVEGLDRAVAWLRELATEREAERDAIRQEAEWLRVVAEVAERDRDEALGAVEAYRSRRAVRVADRFARLFRGPGRRPRRGGR